MDIDDPGFPKTYARVIARAWSDPKFRQRLLDDPAQALKVFGVDVPDGVSLVLVEDSAAVQHLAIPFAMSDADGEADC